MVQPALAICAMLSRYLTQARISGFESISVQQRFVTRTIRRAVPAAACPVLLRSSVDVDGFGVRDIGTGCCFELITDTAEVVLSVTDSETWVRDQFRVQLVWRRRVVDAGQ